MLCLLGSDPTELSDQERFQSKRNARRELFDAVCVRFGLTKLHLLAQPLETTKKQILEVRPGMPLGMENPWADIVRGLKEYADEPV